MIPSNTRLCAIVAITLNIFLHTPILAELTSLQYYDPAPVFSANDSMMPPNSQFLDLKQARWKNELPNKKRCFGLNISGFVQGANSSYSSSGVQYGTVVGVPENGFEMGDFRGTMYAMGVFLGKNPSNGNNIWTSQTDDGDSQNIGSSSINLLFPTITTVPNYSCLNNAAQYLSGVLSTVTPATAQANGALVINSSGAGSDYTSIFSESVLSNDTKYFGAFSMPIYYRKGGMRFEVNFNLKDYIELTIQGGFVNIKQMYTNTIATQATTSSTSCAPIGQLTRGPYSISNLQTVCASGSTGTAEYISPLYANLTQSGTGYATPPTAAAISVFNEFLADNLDEILDPVCGINQSLCAFDDYGAEDLRFYLTFQYPFDPECFNGNCEDGDDWPDMIFTPYAWVGATAPIGKKINYNQLLSLSFGNNGHTSIGGGIGMTFDFAETVEIGFESGCTGFLSKCENRPFPTHPLQRILFPFRTDVQSCPGWNWNFKALLNAYQFLKHVSFWFNYEFIEHRKDSYCVKDSTKAQYFYPDVLTCNSDWRVQFFNAALVFDIQPGFQLSLVWQQPITIRNAYYPVSVLGSINFMF